MHGQGVYKWHDGRIYKGEFARDQKEGQGVLTWYDGRKFDGQWLNGKYHGIGYITDQAGETQKGEWNHGIFKNALTDDVEIDVNKLSPRKASTN